MKRILGLIIAGACVAACTPLKIYHKPGVSVQRWQKDTTTCEVSALRDAPVANEIRRIPPEFIPPRRSCDSAGNCTVIPGYWTPPEVYTVDVNRPLRKKLENQCMGARGYTRVEIEQCPPNIKSEGRTRVLPPLTTKSCAIKNEDGSFLIVDRN